MRSSLLVGLVLIGSAISLTWFVTWTSKDQFDEDSTYRLMADFSDAAGIRWKTRVQISGIDIGKIEGITHERGKDGRLVARVAIRVLDDYEVYANAEIRKAAESLLGDFRLDMDPGGPYDWCSYATPCDEGFECQSNQCIRACQQTMECARGQVCSNGTCTYPKLAPDEVIRNVQSVSDLDAIQSELKQVARNVSDVTESFSRVLSGPEGEGSLKTILEEVEGSMQAIAQATTILSGTLTRNNQAIDGIIRDLHRFTSALAKSTADQGDLQQITENLAGITEQLEQLSRSANRMLEGDMADTEGSLRETMANLNDSVTNLSAITRKIDQGQGTLGRVVNDPAIADKVEQTLDDTNELLGGISRLRTEIELRSQYEVPFESRNIDEIQAALKNILGLRISPKPDKYYQFEVVSDPRGNATRSIVSTSCQGADCPSADADTTDVTREEVNLIAFDSLKFSAQFAKRYYFLTMRFGIIESTGGLGINLHGPDDAAELQLDFFDFNRRKTLTPNRSRLPRLRGSASYELIRHLHVLAGFDDPFNADLTTWFLGGSLRFDDEDIKSLLTVAPSISTQ